MIRAIFPKAQCCRTGRMLLGWFRSSARRCASICQLKLQRAGSGSSEFYRCKTSTEIDINTMSVPSASEWRDIVKLIDGEHSLRDGRPLPDGASAYMNAQQT